MTSSSTVVRSFSVFLLLAFGLSVVMLATDTNLRTDFGAVASGYYAHWYVVLATALVDLVGAVLILITPSRRMLLLGTAGSGLLALLLVGDVLTYSSVGFASAGDFARYLFGVTYYGGDIRYLYDVLLAVYISGFIGGLLALRSVTPTQGP